MLRLFFILIIAKLFILSLPSEILSQDNWSRIVYYNSNGENSADTKKYYIITIRSSGSGKLEYFSNGNIKEYEFQAGKKSIQNFNSLLNKSGIFKIDPEDIKSDSPVQTSSVLNMTIYFEKTKENYLHYNGKEVSEEEIAEKRKEPFLAVPTDYNLKYSDMINKIYTGLEFVVPESIWKKAENDK